MTIPRQAVDPRTRQGLDQLPSGLRYSIFGLLAGVSYFLAARIGMALTFGPHPVSVMWPPNSILFAALLLTPVRAWWVMLLFVVPAHIAAEMESGVPMGMVLCWFISNSFEAVIGAAATRFFLGDRARFDRVRDLSIFFLCGALPSVVLSSFLDAGFVILNDWGKDTYFEVWRMRVFSNFFASTMIVPAIVTWANGEPEWPKTMAGRVEFGLLIAGLVGTTFLTFCRLPVGAGVLPILLFGPLPFFLWATVRFGVRGVSATILIAAVLAIRSSVHAHGPFLSGSPEQNALSIQTFFILLSVTLMPLAAMLHEHKEIAEALSESERRYREVVESQSEIVCRCFAETTFTFVNEACCRYFRRRREDLLGRKILDLVPPAIHEHILLHIAKAIVQRRSLSFESETLLPDRRAGWQQWIIHPIISQDGHIREIQAVGRDITDRKHAEEATRNFAHASRLALVGELTAVIMHEVSQPLSAILTNVAAAQELAKMEKIPMDELRSILTDIYGDDLRAAEAVHRIRDLAKRRDIELQPLRLNDLIEGALRLIGGEAIRRRVQVHTELNTDIPGVLGDAVCLQQVILNLILNAMDAMNGTSESRRILWISTSRNDDEVTVAVRDTGPGVPPELSTKIFQSFFSTKPEGLGLGLSIARSILDAHGGRIWAENHPEGGALFTFSLRALGSPGIPKSKNFVKPPAGEDESGLPNTTRSSGLAEK